jgi:hypothetical protein
MVSVGFGLATVGAGIVIPPVGIVAVAQVVSAGGTQKVTVESGPKLFPLMVTSVPP